MRRVLTHRQNRRNDTLNVFRVVFICLLCSVSNRFRFQSGTEKSKIKTKKKIKKNKDSKQITPFQNCGC